MKDLFINRIKVLIVVFATAMVYSCAKFDVPRGGPKDTLPPRLVEEQSEPNMQTNFNKKSFQLVFDEWIKVSNPSKEVVVSPPLNYPTQILEKGKRVEFSFSENEVLKENVTYQINFGKSIKDFTEGNVYENLIFVFSTGPVIDTLSIKGKVVNAMTSEPEKDIIVSLYSNKEDSVLLKEKPFYFTRTDKEGNFSLNNIREDSYQLFALQDNNVNYIYDQVNEKVAFFDSLVVVDTKMDSSKYPLQLFDEEDPPRYLKSIQEKTGLVKIIYNPFPEKYTLYDINNNEVKVELKNDTMYFFHENLDADSLIYELRYQNITDTIEIKKAKTTMADVKLVATNGGRLSEHKDSIVVEFNKPLRKVNLDSISINDTVQEYQIKNIDLDFKRLIIHTDTLIKEKEVEMTFFPGAVEDVFGTLTSDTIVNKIKMLTDQDFVNIVFKMVDVSDTTYLFQLIKGQELINNEPIIKDSLITFNNVRTGQYKLKIIQDLNSDGTWTYGNFGTRKLPEKIEEVTIDELAPGIDMNLDIDLKKLFDEPEIK